MISELVSELKNPSSGLNKERIKNLMKSVIAVSPFGKDSLVDDYFESYKKVKVILPK